MLHYTGINPIVCSTVLQLWASCRAVCHMGLLTNWSITEIRGSLTQLLWGKTRTRKGEVLDPLNNLIPDIIPKYNLVKFTFTQIKPHSNRSCLKLHYPTGEGECVINVISFALLRLMFFTLICCLCVTEHYQKQPHLMQNDIILLLQ